MARRSFKRRRPFRRRRRVRRARRRNALPLKVPSVPFPRTKIVKLPYSELISLSEDAAGYGSYTWLANSLYDPNFTGTGHQPRYYDELVGPVALTPYNAYTVIGCWYTFIFTNTSVVQHIVGVKHSQILESSPVDGVARICEDPACRWKTIAVEGGGASIVKIRGFINLARMNAMKNWRNLMADNTSGAQSTASPTRVHYIKAQVQAVDNQIHSAAIQVHVKLNYLAVLSDRRLPTKS